MPQQQPKTLQVFVSHSSADTWVAKQIASHVERAGATVFLDADDIEHGDDFDDRIVEAAGKSHELVVLQLKQRAAKRGNGNG